MLGGGFSLALLQLVFILIYLRLGKMDFKIDQYRLFSQFGDMALDLGLKRGGKTVDQVGVPLLSVSK